MCNMANMTQQAQALPATLRAIRAKLDLTQEQLAERLEVSFATVNHWEGGDIKPHGCRREIPGVEILEHRRSGEGARAEVEDEVHQRVELGRLE